MHTLRKSLNQNCSENCETLDFDNSFFFFVNMRPCGVKVSTTSSLKEHTRFAAQNLCIRLGKNSTKVVKKDSEIVNIWHFFCSVVGRLTW